MRVTALPEPNELAKLVEQVDQTGESITLTRGGKPIVDITPHLANATVDGSQHEVVAELDRLRRTLPKSTAAELKAMIEEGRR